MRRIQTFVVFRLDCTEILLPFVDLVVHRNNDFVAKSAAVEARAHTHIHKHTTVILSQVIRINVHNIGTQRTTC